MSYFDIDTDLKESPKDSIVTIYKTGVDSIELLQSIGINLGKMKMLDDTTFHLKKEEFRYLKTIYALFNCDECFRYIRME